MLRQEHFCLHNSTVANYSTGMTKQRRLRAGGNALVATYVQNCDVIIEKFGIIEIVYIFVISKRY